MPSRAQWDALATVWERFEGDGLRVDHLQEIGASLASPCVVIGSGLGLLVRGLEALGVESVVGVDFSPAMARRAQELRGVQTHVASVERLPFDAGQLRSAVVATGVLDPSQPRGLERAWGELARVVAAGGRVVAAVFEASPEFRTFLAGTGLLDEQGRQRTDRIATLWRHRHDPARLVDWVRAWEGSEPARASACLARVESFLRSWFGALDDAARVLASQGESEPEAWLERCLQWSVPGLRHEADLLAAARAHFEPLESRALPRECMRLVVLRRRPSPGHAVELAASR